MYLSLILLDPLSRRVQGRHRTAYQTHRSILTALPEPFPPQERVLFRREDMHELDNPPQIRLLVQSQTVPDWRPFAADHRDGLLAEPQVKSYEPVLQTGQMLSFRLVANPTVKREGRRLGLLREADQIGWLLRKGEAGGFAVALDSLRVTKRGYLRDGTGSGQALTVLVAQFDGLFSVTDAGRFAASLRDGVGSAKGLGCGLLSIAQPH